jgi:hypothetical protein
VGDAPVLAMSRPPTRSAPTTQTAAVLATHWDRLRSTAVRRGAPATPVPDGAG